MRLVIRSIIKNNEEMSGHSFLVDTNMLIMLIDGNDRVAELLNDSVIYVSFITELELLSASGLDQSQIEIIEKLLSDCIVIDINPTIKSTAISIRRTTKVKLPDAIIAATAINLEVPVITADKGFKSINDLTLILFEV